MKFDNHKYWKHVNCIDVFISISGCVFDDDGKNAILHVTWCTQGVNRWWFTYQDRLKITPNQYNNWRQYNPKGKIYL